MRMRRAGYGIIGVGAAVLIGWAGVAFACSPMPEVYSVFPESAAPGSTVAVEGRSVTSPSPVEIRWNGVRGQVLAAATPVAGALSVPVQIPDVPPGVYSLSLVTAQGVGRTAFEVTGQPRSETAAASRVWPTVGDRGLAAAPSAAGPNVFGVGLLAVGLAGLFAGSTVAVARRRRVPAGLRR